MDLATFCLVETYYTWFTQIFISSFWEYVLFKIGFKSIVIKRFQASCNDKVYKLMVDIKVISTSSVPFR